MRSLLVACLLLACSGGEETPAVADASLSSCQTTSCVTGATCSTPVGVICKCIETGQWACGATATTPTDGGFTFDTDPGPPSDTKFVAPPAETGSKSMSASYPLTGSCDLSPSACTSDESEYPSADSFIRSVMNKCGLSCTSLTLEVTEAGCPQRVSINYEWITGAFECTRKDLGNYRYPCGRVFEVSTTGCPD
jgi:hypothetical protein